MPQPRSELPKSIDMPIINRAYGYNDFRFGLLTKSTNNTAIEAMRIIVRIFDAPLFRRMAPPIANRGSSVSADATTICSSEKWGFGSFGRICVFLFRNKKTSVTMSRPANILKVVSGRSSPSTCKLFKVKPPTVRTNRLKPIERLIISQRLVISCFRRLSNK